MNAQPPLSIILVGCGAVSQQFYLPALRTLAKLGTLKVAALVDPSASARAVLAPSFPGAQQVDALAAVQAPEGSLAIIATPPRFHAEQTKQSVEKGWHVLCEKPMASTAAECAEMIAAAAAHHRLLAVGLYKRFFPSSQYIKQLRDQGQLGELKSFTVSEGGPFRWPAATPSFFNKAQTHGGVLLDIGVHVLDLLIWWFGEPARFDYADDAMGGLETNVHLDMHYTNGAVGRVHLSRDWKTPNEYRFVFERGIVAWKVNDANGLTLQLNGTPAALRSSLVHPVDSSATDATASALLPTNPQSFIHQLQNIAAAIRTGEPLLIPGEEGRRSLKLIEDCYANRRLVVQPWLTEAEAARAQHLVSAP